MTRRPGRASGVDTIVKGACPHDCPDTCALEVHVKDGVALKVTGSAAHAPTAGVLCTKVARYTERTYHPDRLLHPLRRIGKKGEGRFERICWEEAIATVAARLSRDRRGGSRADPAVQLRGHHGTGAGRIDVAALLPPARREPPGSHHLRLRRHGGHKITLGPSIGVDVEVADEAKLIIFWGCNAITSSVHFWARAQEAKRRGATLIAIDPYRSLTAEKCHEHIALLPGTDGALALGLMHVLIRDDLIDRDYVTAPYPGLRGALRTGERVWTRRASPRICGITRATSSRLRACTPPRGPR